MSDIEKLRQAAHDAPMNKVFTDHKGRKFLATHSMAWAAASEAWMKAVDEAAAALPPVSEPRP